MTKRRTPLCLAALAAALAGCARQPDTPPPAAAPATPADARTLAVRVETAAERPFERRLTVQGTFEARRYANVAARTDGNLDAIWVDEGDTVTAGETRLFQIDPVQRRNALTIAEQALDVAKASLQVAVASAEQARVTARKAQADFERYARLHEQGTVTDNEYEVHLTQNAQAQAGVAVAEAHVDLATRQGKQAEAALAIAHKNLEDALVVAPISGVVSQRRAEPGEQMSVGHVILRIDDLSEVEAAAFLPAQYYAEVTPGKTTFRLTVGGRDAGTHTVTYRSPTINPTLRTFEVKGRVDASTGLAVPGNMADLTLVFATRQGLGVPTASLLTRAGRQVVFVVRDGRAAQVEVTTGLQNDAWTEILTGLAAGDRVVTEGQTQLRDGAPVDVR